MCLFSLQAEMIAQCFIDFCSIRASYFIGCSSVSVCSVFFVVRYRLFISGRNFTEMMLCSSHCILLGSTWYWFVSLLMVFILIIRLRCCLLGFTTVKLLFNLCNSCVFCVVVLWNYLSTLFLCRFSIYLCLFILVYIWGFLFFPNGL